MSTNEKLVALSNMKEFDPAYERHFPLLIVKAVDPGCTLELQVENACSGEVVRITSTENEQADWQAFERAVLDQLRLAWNGLKPYDKAG